MLPTSEKSHICTNKSTSSAPTSEKSHICRSSICKPDQSYAQIVDPKRCEADLAQLGTRLKLPKDWRFQVVTLDTDLVLRTFEGGEAHVTQDEL
ncbi:MAG: hypothetical protein KGS48_09805 [Bacteroidetes bacterium]|nr:hypothetical protein [Bacteroidota bacterium]